LTLRLGTSTFPPLNGFYPCLNPGPFNVHNLFVRPCDMLETNCNPRKQVTRWVITFDKRL